MDFNNCSFGGRLTSDAELKYSKDQNPYSTFRMAVNNKKDQSVVFLNVVVFGKSAEGVTKFLKKGTGVIIAGELKVEEYEKEGVKRSSLTVTARDVQLVNFKKEDE